MEAVAEHINEMQKIYEEYGHVFDELTRQYRETHAHTKVHRSSPEHSLVLTSVWKILILPSSGSVAAALPCHVIMLVVT